MDSKFDKIFKRMIHEQSESDDEVLDTVDDEEEVDSTDIDDLDDTDDAGELDDVDTSDDEDTADDEETDDEDDADSFDEVDDVDDSTDDTEEDAEEAIDNESDGVVFKNLCDVISAYSDTEATLEKLVELLNIAVTDELLASYNYLASHSLAKTEGRSDFVDEFKAHESEELDHAHDLITRIREMKGVPLQTEITMMPGLNSNGIAWKQELSQDSSEILLNRYYEELGAIKFYGFILDYLHELKKAGTYDSTTHTVIKKIKADEERHALDLRDLLDEYGIEHDDDEALNCTVEEEDDYDDDTDADDADDNAEDIPDEEEDDDDEDLGEDIPESEDEDEDTELDDLDEDEEDEDTEQ